MKRLAVTILVLAAGSAAGVSGRFVHSKTAPTELLLEGNVDLRQTDLAFNNSERIAAVLVQEGIGCGRARSWLGSTRVVLEPQVAQAEAQAAAQRQVLERLRNGSRPEEIAQARAQVAAQRQVVERMHNGSRPEEIAQARANVESAKADLLNARHAFDRAKSLLPANAISRDDYDTIQAALDVAQAKLVVNQKSLDLAIAGPRNEDVAQAEAQLAACQQQARFDRCRRARKEDIAQAEAQLQGGRGAGRLPASTIGRRPAHGAGQRRRSHADHGAG